MRSGDKIKNYRGPSFVGLNGQLTVQLLPDHGADQPQAKGIPFRPVRVHAHAVIPDRDAGEQRRFDEFNEDNTRAPGRERVFDRVLHQLVDYQGDRRGRLGGDTQIVSTDPDGHRPGWPQ